MCQKVFISESIERRLRATQPMSRGDWMEKTLTLPLLSPPFQKNNTHAKNRGRERERAASRAGEPAYLSGVPGRGSVAATAPWTTRRVPKSPSSCARLSPAKTSSTNDRSASAEEKYGTVRRCRTPPTFSCRHDEGRGQRRDRSGREGGGYNKARDCPQYPPSSVLAVPFLYEAASKRAGYTLGKRLRLPPYAFLSQPIPPRPSSMQDVSK